MTTTSSTQPEYPAEFDAAVARMNALAEPPAQPASWVRELCRRMQAGSPPDAAAERIPLDWSA